MLPIGYNNYGFTIFSSVWRLVSVTPSPVSLLLSHRCLPGQEPSLHLSLSYIRHLLFIHFKILLCVWAMFATACMCRSEDRRQEPVLSFHCVGPSDRTQIIRLGTEHLYPLSHLTRPRCVSHFSIHFSVAGVICQHV